MLYYHTYLPQRYIICYAPSTLYTTLIACFLNNATDFSEVIFLGFIFKFDAIGAEMQNQISTYKHERPT